MFLCQDTEILFLSAGHRSRVSGLEKVHQLSERLAPLGIIGAQLRALLKPGSTIVLCWFEGYQRVPQLGSHDGERRKSLRV